jgi:hypothetical protein
MNPFVFIIASIIVVIIIVLAYQQTYVIEEQKPATCKQKPLFDSCSSMQTKVRCPPQEMLLYDESIGYVRNKGFLNETIYRPEFDYSQLKFESGIMKNNVPLNEMSCAFSTDLPLGNIHTTYLINNNSAKLSL